MRVDRCVYCGVPADSVDHLVPQHLLRRAGDLNLDLSEVMRFSDWTRPCCRECNSMLGGRLHATLAERRADAHRGIRKKYSAYLRIPNWDEDELAELGPMAAIDVRNALKMRDWVRYRLAYRGQKFEDAELPSFRLALAAVRAGSKPR